jgi:hypothetical protein
MKEKIADSVVLSSANLIIIALVYGLPLVKDRHEISPLFVLVLAFAVLPVTFLLALGYTIRDLIRPGMRVQAILALLLSVPTGIFLGSIRLDI